MKKIERVYREILYQFIENKKDFLKQKTISKICNMSLSSVNYALRFLSGAIEKKPMGFRVINPKKILLYWASIRNLRKDIIYSTFVSEDINELEKLIPPKAIYTAFSAYKFKFKQTPSDYDSLYFYSSSVKEVQFRYPQSESKVKNVFVLKPDPHLENLSKNSIAPLCQIYVDIWNIPKWYSNEFIKFLGEEIGIME